MIVVGVLLVVIECLCLGTVSVCKVFSVSAVLVTECLVVTKFTSSCFMGGLPHLGKAIPLTYRPPRWRCTFQEVRVATDLAQNAIVSSRLLHPLCWGSCSFQTLLDGVPFIAIRI